MLLQAAGCARFAYNWALEWWGSEYKEYKAGNREYAPSAYSASVAFNDIKKEQFPWVMQSTKCASQLAIYNLGDAFKRFMKGQNNYPKFKSKRRSKLSFQVDNLHFRVDDKKVYLPKIGLVRMYEPLRLGGKIMRGTVYYRAGMWFINISVKMPDVPKNPQKQLVGVDVGVREYVVSDGRRFEVPRALRAKQKQLKRAQQSLSRKQKGSKNREKAKLKVGKLHYKISNIRKDWLHKMTTELAEHPVAIETLNVQGMLKNHRLAMSINDAAFYEFSKQLEYKTVVTKIDQWYPSSQICSNCQARIKLGSLSIRSWTCYACGMAHDRDLNAAINIKNAVGHTVSARGEFLAAALPNAAQAASMKQESFKNQKDWFVRNE